MNIYYNFDDAQTALNSPTIVAVGSFDGVHRGHRLLIKQMNEVAKEKNLTPMVITFWPHPKQVLTGKCKLLSSIDEKIILLEEAGAENVLVVNFTKEFSKIPHSSFTEHYLRGKLNTKAIILSDDHSFGCNREGSNETIINTGLEIITLPRFENISSTAIRNAIENGDLETAHKLLGERYLIMQPIDTQVKIMPQSIDKQHIRYAELKLDKINIDKLNQQ